MAIPAPPSLIFGPGAGVGATGGVVGTDSSGVISITTGIFSPMVDAVVASLVFTQPFGTAPKQVILTPANAAAAAFNANVFAPALSLTASGFDLSDTLVPLTAGTLCVWYFIVTD